MDSFVAMQVQVQVQVQVPWSGGSSVTAETVLPVATAKSPPQLRRVQGRSLLAIQADNGVLDLDGIGRLLGSRCGRAADREAGRCDCHVEP